MSQTNIVVKIGSPCRLFSESFKKQVVQEFERGFLNKDQLKAKYGISGKSTILNWCRKYGNFVYSQKIITGRPMKDPQQRRIKELEKRLKEAEVKLIIYDKLIEITNRGMDIDMKKKIEAELLKSFPQKKE